jgi:predicted Zn-dependent peptidase
MNGEQLAQAMDQLGATVTPLSFTAIPAELAQALPLMAEMLKHPTFPSGAVDQQKGALAGTIQRNEARADTLANRLLTQILFGPDHRLGRVTTAASIASITRDDLIRFHEANVRPQNATLVIVGDVTPKSVMPLVTRAFGDWQKTGERAVVNVRAGVSGQPTSIYLFDRPGSPQTTVRIGQIGPPRSSPDYYALDLATNILGGASGSRLAKSLREQHALTYGVTHITQWRASDDPSTIVGSANVEAAKTDSALLVWMGELNDIRGRRPITDQELEFGRAITVGNMATRFETYDAIANQVGSQARDHLPMTFIDDYVRHINATPASEATRIAERYLNPTHTVIVVVGDRKTIEAPLRATSLGPVVIVDATGRPIQ